LAVFLWACAFVESPSEHAHSQAQLAGFRQFELSGTGLMAYVRGENAQRLVIYVESDGAPWRMPDEPPADPTPLKPLVLRMAISDPSPAVAYLARPCQYLATADLARCDPDLWMQGRFREEAVATTSHAVDLLKRRFSATKVALVGYSGGGTMATLVAARRADVECLVSVASPLDTRAWTSLLGVSALVNSLNPVNVVARLVLVPQTHFRGANDTVVPFASSRRFFDAVPNAKVVDISGFDHDCCWATEWLDLRSNSCLTS
jgi:pimeloyl-ACP methyl ester carboxylesterase